MKNKTIAFLIGVALFICASLSLFYIMANGPEKIARDVLVQLGIK